MIKVLVVDDSAVSRELIKNILEGDPGIKVAGMASNGEEAIALAAGLRPDVITMDINMPGLNGLETTRKIMEQDPVPIVIVTASYDPGDVEKSFLAIEAGALAILEKPFGAGHSGYRSSSGNLLQTVKLMSEVKVVKRWPKQRYAQETNKKPALVNPDRGARKEIRLVAIGASTGGPPVIQTILKGLRPGFAPPVVIVQHIAAGFLEGFIDWLGQTTGHNIHKARNGEPLQDGHVYLAPDNFHLGVSRGKIELSLAEPENGTRPSVSYLFRSALKAYGPDMAAVLLTGMGRDGAQEMKALNEAGAATIVQDKESSVVFGMPGEALRLGAAEYVLAPEKIPAIIEALVSAGNNK